MQKRFIRLSGVKEKTGLPKSTIYRKISEDDFPKQISIGSKMVAWLESDIDKWIDERMKEATNDNSPMLQEELELL